MGDDLGDRLDRSIGLTLRGARQDSGLTMAQLAAKAGISQPHLSQMENGKASPSISTLYRLATALQVSPQELLPKSTSRDLVVIRAGSAKPIPIIDHPDAAQARVLLGTPDRSLQVQEVVVEAGQTLGDWFEHEGEEFLFMLDGDLTIELRGLPAQTLGPGDGAWYDSSTPHRWRAEGLHPVRVLAVSAVPGRDTVSTPHLADS